MGLGRKLIIGVVLVAAVAWPLIGADVQQRIETALQPDEGGCPHSGDLPGRDNLADIRAATLCLLNARRAEHGLVELTEDRKLELAAERHSRDMGRRDFFAHESPGGRGLEDRLRAVRYRGPLTGENLAWGTETEATPKAIVAGWMDSPGHRANILRPGFEEIGIGIGLDAPQDVEGQRAAVYTTAFGSR